MKIFLTKRAIKQYYSILEYLNLHWGEKVVKSIKSKTLHLFDILEQYPHLGKIENDEKQIRGILLTKHTRILYRIKGNQIIITSFFDLRQRAKSKK